jgi:SPP1 family phage portal protein
MANITEQYVPLAVNHRGRHQIKVDNPGRITASNVLEVLHKALPEHEANRRDIIFLDDYYRGVQPILNRNKPVRPEINNKIVENRANEIVAFKTGYLLTEPLQYISKNGDENTSEAVRKLNDFMEIEGKEGKDVELTDWFHICGTAYRMILPRGKGEEKDGSLFHIYTLDPAWTFVVYSREVGNPPLMGVTYYIDERAKYHYSIYTKDSYFEVTDDNVVSAASHIMGDVPIIEYPLERSRIGAFELVIDLLNAINLTDSNRLDGLEQFIQALLLLHNVELDSDGLQELIQKGAIKYRDADSTLKGEITYLVSSLDQTQTQSLVDHLYETVLTICGMPNRNGGTSTSDTGSAVVMRDGWSAAETRAKRTEIVFKQSERKLIQIALTICKAFDHTGAFNTPTSGIDIRFTRRNYENVAQKSTVLTQMLASDKIHPKLAFESSGMFADPELAYTVSDEYRQEQEQKALDLMEKQQNAERKEETPSGSTD